MSGADESHDFTLPLPIGTEAATPEAKPSRWRRLYQNLVLCSFTLFWTGLGLFCLFSAPYFKYATTAEQPLATAGVYTTPLVFRANCAVGTWIGYVGVLWQNQTQLYYPGAVCGATAAGLNASLAAAYPVGGTATLWYYASELPTPRLYLSQPQTPYGFTTIVALFWSTVALMAQALVVLPVNAIAVNCCGQPAIGFCCCLGKHRNRFG